MASFLVPPGGFAGFSQMTPASRAALFPGGRRAGGGKRRKKRATKRATKRAKRTKGKRKLKFGSPAWRKKYMRK